MLADDDIWWWSGSCEFKCTNTHINTASCRRRTFLLLLLLLLLLFTVYIAYCNMFFPLFSSRSLASQSIFWFSVCSAVGLCVFGLSIVYTIVYHGTGRPRLRLLLFSSAYIQLNSDSAWLFLFTECCTHRNTALLFLLLAFNAVHNKSAS